MKNFIKILFISVSLFCAGNFCFGQQKLYLNLNISGLSGETQENVRAQVFKIVNSVAEKRNIQIIDLGTLHFNDDFYIAYLKKDLQSYISERDYEKKMKEEGVIRVSPGKPVDYDELIRKTQEKIDAAVPEESCFPKLDFYFTYKESSWSDLCFSVNPTFYREYNKEGVSSFVTFSKKMSLSSSEISKFVAAYICSYFSFLNKKTPEKSVTQINEQKKTPFLVDIRDVKGSVKLAARNDYSFVMKDEDHFADYSFLWNENASYDNTLNNLTQEKDWSLYCADGENILLANTETPNLYSINKNKKLTKASVWNYAKGKMSVGFQKDGTPYCKDIFSRKLYCLDKNGEAATDYSAAEFFISPTQVTSGPDNNFYFFCSSTIFVFTENSILKNIISIDNKSDLVLSSVNDEGSMIFADFENKVFYKYSNSGKLLWEFNFPESINYPVLADYKNGMLYAFDSTTKKIARIAESDAPVPETLKRLAKGTNVSGSTLKEQAQVYLSLADTYFENASYDAAIEQYEKYLQISPTDFKAVEKKQTAENYVNKKSAEKYYNSALELFDEYGEETAGEDYREAIKLLEKLKKSVPWDEEVLEMYKDLKQTFHPEENIKETKIPSIVVEEVEVVALFPVMMNYYAERESGYVQVKNISDSEITNLRVSSFARNYMDFAVEGETVEALGPGESCLLSVKTPINKKSLSLNEAVKVQMQFTVKWNENNSGKSLTISRPVTIYNKSSISWDDTAMLSCFVQPNNESVKDFVFSVLQKKNQIIVSKNINKVIKLSHAIASIPLTYVSDPNSPVSQLIDNKYSVDTVRFANDTLRLKGGDCDDMTALFCTVLEAAGISTAFVTTPEHIFAAFCTGDEYSVLWENLNPEVKVIELDGKVWIPVETTILNKGFYEAWKSASKEILENDFDFTLLSDAWKTYTSVDESPEKIEVAFEETKFDKLNSSSASSINECFKEALSKTMLVNMTSSQLNSAAIIYYHLGESAQSIKILESAIKKDPAFEQTYKNLASLYKATGDSAKSLAYQKKYNQLNSGADVSGETQRAEDAEF